MLLQHLLSIQLLNVDTTYFACEPENTPHPIGSYMVLGVYGLIAQLILMSHKSYQIHGFHCKGNIIQDIVSLVVWSNQ